MVQYVAEKARMQLRRLPVVVLQDISVAELKILVRVAMREVEMLPLALSYGELSWAASCATMFLMSETSHSILPAISIRMRS